MSDSTSLTGQETITPTLPGGGTVTVTLNQIAALVALQVAVDLQAIAQQVVGILNGAGVIALPQSSYALTPLATAQSIADWFVGLSTSDPGTGIGFWNDGGVIAASVKAGS